VLCYYLYLIAALGVDEERRALAVAVERRAAAETDVRRVREQSAQAKDALAMQTQVRVNV
jgi:hypothetical protein